MGTTAAPGRARSHPGKPPAARRPHLANLPRPLLGLPHLIRLAIRRDRLRIPLWVLSLAFLPVLSYTAYGQLFPTEADRQGLNRLFGSNPAFTLLLGPLRDLSTPGGFTTWRALVFAALFAGLMAIFTVVRHTRAEEDAGRAELVAAGVVGQHARLAAGVWLAVATSNVAAVLIIVNLLLRGAEPGGAVALGAAVAVTGWAFAGVAAVAAQVASFARTAIGVSVALLLLSFALRGWGDSVEGLDWLTWLSPLGWAVHVDPFGDENWAALVPGALSLPVLVGIAVRLQARRDLGAGLVQPRPGRPRATDRLRGLLTLAGRLQRGLLLGWLVGLAAMGSMFGSVGGSVADAFRDNPFVDQVIGGGQVVEDLSAAFTGFIITWLAVLAGAQGIGAVGRALAEESEGRLEPVLATAVGRRRWLASHLIFAVGGPVATALLGALAYARVSAAGGEPTPTGEILLAALGNLTATATLIALAAALLGWRPRAFAVAWGAFGVSFVLTFFGALLNLPDWALDLSPFTHVPQLPPLSGQTVETTPFLWLGGIAVVLLAAAFVGIRRRDIPA